MRNLCFEEPSGVKNAHGMSEIGSQHAHGMSEIGSQQTLTSTPA
jgi:hypothetical protein